MSWATVDKNTPKNKPLLVVSEKFPEVHEAVLRRCYVQAPLELDANAPTYEWITYSVNGPLKDNPTHWMDMPAGPGASDDFWVVLARGRGDARDQLHAGSRDRQGAIDLAFSISRSFRTAECQVRIVNLADSLNLTLDEGDLIYATNSKGNPIKINSTRAN